MNTKHINLQEKSIEIDRHTNNCIVGLLDEITNITQNYDAFNKEEIKEFLDDIYDILFNCVQSANQTISCRNDLLEVSKIRFRI